MADCPCNWEAGFGGIDGCEPQTPGVKQTGVFICADKVAARIETEPDASDTSKGVITDVTLVTGEKGYPFLSRDKSVLVQSGQSINDNGGKTLAETIAGNGFLSSENYNWMEAHIGKRGLFIFEDKEETLWGMEVLVNDFNANWGQNPEDLKAITYNFTNDEFPRVTQIVPDSATYADNAAFLAAMTA